MPRNWTLPLLGVAAGSLMGAVQVVRENAATWDAVHATPVTIVLQTAAGALVGGAFIGAAALYWSMRQGPARAKLAPQRVRAGSPDWAVPRERRAAPADIRYGVRHVFVMLFGLGLLAAGGVILLACLRHPTVYGLARGGFGAVFLLGLGGYLLWDDFVAPHLRGAKP